MKPVHAGFIKVHPDMEKYLTCGMRCLRLILTTGLLYTSTNGPAQNHFVKTDLAGYAYKAVAGTEAKPVMGPRFSLGYEHGLPFPDLSLSFLAGYGYTPSSGRSGDLQYGYITSRHGFILFSDIRYYHPFRKRGEADTLRQILKGFFVGAYNGNMYMEEELFRSGPMLGTDYVKVRSQYTWIQGFGALAGYKQLFWKKAFIEGLLGIAPGARSDLWRLELYAGYCF